MKKLQILMGIVLCMANTAIADNRTNGPQRSTRSAPSSALAVTSGQIFNSFDTIKTVTAILIPIDSTQDQALIQVSGVNHPLNAQTLLYDLIRHKAYSRQQYKVSGLDRTYLSFRGKKTLKNGTLQAYGELYFEQTPIKVLPTKPHPDPNAILTTYLAEQHLVPTNNRKTAEKISEDLQNLADQTQRFCKSQQPMHIDIDWPTFKPRSQWPSMGKHYIRALRTLCREDEDYRAEISTIEALIFTQSSNLKIHQIRREKNRMVISLAVEMPNVRLLARHWFEENL